MALALPVGWLFLAVGLYAWHRSPDNSFGRLLLGFAFAWFAAGRRRTGDPLGALSPREREVLALMAEGRSRLEPTPDDHRRILAVLAYLNA